MAVRFNVTIDPPKFRSPSEMKRDVGRALKLFDEYYRKRVQQRFVSQGPGWSERVERESTQHVDERVQALATHKLKLKLLKDLRRAQRNVQRGRGTTAAIVRRARVYQEFRKQIAGDHSPFFSSDQKLEKSVGKLRERFGRAEKAAASRILGKMANAMKSRRMGMVLEITNTIPWSGVQNDGGTVGHGAKLPARPFNYFDATDVEVFSEIAVNCTLLALS